MKELTDQLARDGFHLPTISLDSTIVRFDRNGKKNNAWFIGFQNHTVKGGEPYVYCLYGDWSESNEWRVWASRKLTRADQAASKAQYEEIKRKVQEEKKIKQKEAAEKAEKRLATAPDKGLTPYCKRKNIDQLYGCKVHEFDTLLVPVRDINGKTQGLQYIYEDGEKKFMAGTKVESGFHLIGGEIETEVIICEGFATGVTVHRAIKKPVVIAFNAGNLLPVAKEIRLAYPDIKITVCADNDRHHEDGKNPGVEKATKAAMICHGSLVVPEFQGEQGTDFNDLESSEGVEAVIKQFLEDGAEVQVGYIPLGYDESTYFFYNKPSKDIVKVGTFAKHQLFQIAPKEYWDEKYPGTKDGEADYNQAMNDLIQMSRKVGPFDSSRIRGTGVWIDEGRIVVNSGHCLIVNGRELPMSGLKSWFIYVQTRNRIPPLTDPLTVGESKLLADICESLRWRDPKSGALLAGWLAIARVSSAMDIRPHIWLTGGAGTGKTTVMDRLVSPALGCPKGKIHLQGASTEAGIRQRIKSSSVPIIFDEFETTGEHSKARIQSCLELLRVAWSSKSGAVVKGSAGGHSVEYQVAFSALVSSIRVNLENDADRSRFSVLELEPHGNDCDRWETIQKGLLEIDEAWGERLFARSVGMVKIMIASQTVFNRVLAGVMNQRYGQQVGTLLAGYWSLLSDDVVTEALAKGIVSELGQSEDEIDEMQTTDEVECLDYLLSYRFQVRRADGAMDHKNIREVIEDTSMFQNEYIKSIRGYGILVRQKDQGWEMLVAYRGSELQKIFKLTRWTQWSITLNRLKGSKKTSFRSGSDYIKAVCIRI